MFLTEAEILRNGNDGLLNSLEEGVIIQQLDSKKILFQNKAAKQIASIVREDLSEVGLGKSFEALLDHDQEIFAMIDPSIFEKTPIDVREIITTIDKMDNFISISQILESETEKGYPGEQHIYKIMP